MKLQAFLACLLLVAGVGAKASCDYPKPPKDLPTGKTESKDEMLDAQQRVKSYVADMENYLQCLDDEIAAMGEAATEEHIVIRDKRHNAAVDAMETVAASFNSAVRTYKDRQ